MDERTEDATCVTERIGDRERIGDLERIGVRVLLRILVLLGVCEREGFGLEDTDF